MNLTTLGEAIDFDSVPIFFDRNPTVFAMPDVLLAPSLDSADMVIGRIQNFDRGHLFSYAGQGMYLSLSAHGVGYGMLNVSTGESVERSTLRGEPVEIRRWSLVGRLFDKMITVFAFPEDPTRPLGFA